MPSVRTFNKRDAILANANKFGSLQKMQSAGVRVPPFSRDWRDLTFPMLGRSSNHQGGTDVRLYLQPKDIEMSYPAAYYVQYVPKVKEYRVHVCNGKVLKVIDKRYNPDSNAYDQLVWNFRTGHQFFWGTYLPMHNAAITAVQAMGLDFGAVDCIVGHEDGELYILEVNTAPGIDLERTAMFYADELRSMMETNSTPA